MESTQEFSRRELLEDFEMATPLGRFWINYWRKRRRGEPPLRIREVRAELRGIYAERKARGSL